ncbi:MAG: NAD-dependent epimerase/dehydratase [uncultured bacterium]|nr:MAG: NAD-dependent epimerase/dehydratase [uncultured bacterium]
MNKDIYLVTGATGFVGANIVRRLVKEGKDVHVLSRNKILNWRLSDLKTKIKAHEVDLLDYKLDKVISKIKPTYIFHLAAYGSLPKEDKIEDLINVNLKGTINLINASKKVPFKLFINTGSSSEYGVKFGKMIETDLSFPINDYGVIKTAVTLYVHKEAVRNNLPIITFRLFSAYGPYEHKPRFIPTVVRAAIKNDPISVGNKKNVRDFIYIEDMVDAYLNTCKVKINPGEIFNIGTGRQHTLEETVNRIVNLSGSRSKVEWGAVPIQERQVESGKWQADTRKTSKMLRWRAKHSLDEGLLKTIEWFSKNNYLYE